MSVKPVTYRTPSQIKRDFKDVSVWWLSRRRLAKEPPPQYERLKSSAASLGVSRIIAAKIDLTKMSEAELESCVKERLIMNGQVLDLRVAEKKRSLAGNVASLFRFLYLKLLQGVYSIKLRFTKADINLAHFHNRFGEKIVAIVDFPEGDFKKQEIPWVIIPPAFGKRKETYFLMALFLKKNGIGVLRYDDSCSVGESDGDIKDLTLSLSTENILAAVSYVSRRLKGKVIGLAPFSLSARPAIKAATRDRRISFLFPIVGSPSIQSLLSRVYGEDLIADFAAGMRKGMLNLLGHFINSSHFLGDAHKHGFADLASTKADLERIGIPIVWFCGTQDPWVDHKEVQEALDVNPKGGRRELRVFPDLTHRFREAVKAQEIFAQAVRTVLQLTQGREVKEVERPWTGEIVKQALLERRRIQTLITEEEKIKLWTNYLEGFGILKETDDYMSYLSDLAREIALQPGERLLDAGCGNGYIVEYLLGKMVNDVLAEKIKGSVEGEIIGVDIVTDALDRAQEIIGKVKIKHRELPSVVFLKQDVDGEELPFGDWHFDKVVASLLLSYLRHPHAAVRELCRVLKPGGTIVLTSLKPDADVSQIYFKFIEKLKAKYAGEEQRELWKKGRDQFNQAVSWIEGKEEEGIFKYLSASELRDLLRENGITGIRVIRSFGDQALIVVGRKA
jgi:ubiquinone/menaquinone biosynthesis C-methylase UbiE